jgi:competence ComEA-like helix-hairpin-helix protein
MKLFSFTKSETRVILFIVSILISGYSIKYYKQIIKSSEQSPYDFSASDSLFKQRSEKINKNGKNQTETDTAVRDLNLTAAEDSLYKRIKEEGASYSDSSDVNIININTAGKNDLINLPGIGETLADRIISYRNEKKGFRKKEELMNVSGIGKKKFDKLKNYVKAE